MSALPTGTVTFLFTDIEGSTRLWEQHPEAMRQALARHDALLTDAIEQHGGLVIKSRGEGDSFFAVFTRATDAITAAAAVQRSLVGEPWLTPEPLRVRVALHTGDAELREGDYFGAAVNRCARLRAAAHGGQVLLTQPTAAIARDALPDGTSLRDLGEHRLKDLARPERVFQLLHPALPASFPPLRSLDTLPNNLPQQVTSFIGRDRELETVKQRLAPESGAAGERLLTLTGAGGTGKTRLALPAAADLLERFEAGVWLVELAPLSDPALVAQSVAAVLGVPETGKPLQQSLVEALQPKSLLLVLDNCEHVLEASAALADVLLRGCPKVRLLTTSREGLNIPGETTYRLPSLSAPPAKGDLHNLSQYESVRLFVDRAAAAAPAFVLTEQNAPAVAQVCRRLDGIPLAIELATARLRALSVEQLAARLDDRFRLLTGGSRTALPRQQTLRALIDWSYDLLSPPERALLHRLSVFAGGWTLEAAEAGGAGGEIEDGQVLDLLTGLVDKSLVGVDEQDGEARYRLLETVRQYARDRLLESGEGAAARDRHLRYFLSLAEQVGAPPGGMEQAAGFRRLERELDNLRAALDWSHAVDDGGEIGLRLVVAPGPFWSRRGYYSEGREILEASLERGTAAPPALRARALLLAGEVAEKQGEAAAAGAFLEESLAIYRELGEPEGIAQALHALAWVSIYRGDLDTARPLLHQAMALWRERPASGTSPSRGHHADSLSSMGWLAVNERDPATAGACFEESARIRRELGDSLGLAYDCAGMGTVLNIRGEYEAARAILEESLALARAHADQHLVVWATFRLGHAARGLGDHERARVCFAESLAQARAADYPLLVARSLSDLASVALACDEIPEARSLVQEGFQVAAAHGSQRLIAGALRIRAQIALAEGAWELAARLLGAAEPLGDFDETLLLPVPLDGPRGINAARVALGDAAFDAAWAAGRATPLDRVIQETLQGRDPF